MRSIGRPGRASPIGKKPSRHTVAIISGRRSSQAQNSSPSASRRSATVGTSAMESITGIHRLIMSRLYLRISSGVPCTRIRSVYRKRTRSDIVRSMETAQITNGPSHFYDAYILDLDGTVYLGDAVLPG